MKNVYLIFLVPVIFINCSAYKYSVPSDEGIRYLKENNVFNDIVLGVDRKVEYDNLIQDDSLWIYVPSIKIDEIISELQRNSIFKEVAFVDELKNEPNILLTSYLGADQQFRECMQCLISAVSLGIIPSITRFDEVLVITFTSPNMQRKDDLKLNTHLKYTDAFGWIFGIIRRSSKWSKEYDENNYWYSIYNELFLNKDEILKLAQIQ